MYLPPHFAQTDAATLQALLAAHPLATLVTPGADGITADHVPLQFIADAGTHGILRGHVARANPLWQHAAGHAVLAVFNGPEAYVSPSWYAAKAATHKVVPTWNYTVVHARGTLRAVDDAPWLHALVSGLTGQQENGRAVPWAVGDAPADFVQQLLGAIVGIEVELTAPLLGKWKISQNRSRADRQGVADGLAAEAPASRVATVMSLAALVAPAADG